MAIQREKVRVLIPTTAGPVEVLRLIEEEEAVGRSVVCIGGTTETADIDAGYNAFVARATGVIARLFGHRCYRLDVSGRIDSGSSWQLAVLLAHGLYAAGRLAQEGEPTERVVWATGTVRVVDLAVGAVSHVREKLATSLGHLEEEALARRSVVVAVPAANASELGAEMPARLAASAIEVVNVDTLMSLWDRLALPAQAVARPVPREPSPIRRRIAGHKWFGWAGAAAVAALAMFTISGVLIWSQVGIEVGRPTAASEKPASTSERPAPTSEGPAPEGLVRVPLRACGNYLRARTCLEAKGLKEGRDFVPRYYGSRQGHHMWILPHVRQSSSWTDLDFRCLRPNVDLITASA